MSKKLICIIYIGFLASVIHGEINSDASSRSEQSLEKQITSDPKNKVIPEPFDVSVNESLVPSVRQGELMLEEMCRSAGGNSSYDTASSAIRNIKNCFDGIIKFAELPAKIEKARPVGELDTVFNEYCLKSDELKGCVNKFLIDVEPCLADSQKSAKYTIQNISEAILKFACENEGDHIALFISEKGPQCISSKQPGIERCVKNGMNETRTRDLYDAMVNSTNFTSLQQVGSDPEKPFTFSFELEQCRTAYSIRNCIVDELRTCTGSTPANVVESIFNLIQHSTTCNKYKQQEIDPNYNGASSYTSGVSLLQSMFCIIIPILTILSARTFSS